MVTIIDGDGLLVGRLASNVAKRALAGEEIAVINAEKAIISGNRARVLNNYKQKRQRGSREGGPFFPRRPDHILKRTIRGLSLIHISETTRLLSISYAVFCLKKKTKKKKKNKNHRR